jgi:hypothetical protein
MALEPVMAEAAARLDGFRRADPAGLAWPGNARGCG